MHGIKCGSHNEGIAETRLRSWRLFEAPKRRQARTGIQRVLSLRGPEPPNLNHTFT
jgi:hypothetical protein